MPFNTVAKSLHSGAYRPDIDGIRAIAVGVVVINHAVSLWMPGGFIGVDIFFVLSGYLISKIILGDVEKGRFSILHFYDRRIRRIFPALVVVLCCTLAVAWLVFFAAEYRLLGRHVVSASAFYENFQLWSESGYFDADSETKPLLHLWSLAVEEQFYLFWPVLLFFTRGWRHGQLGVMLLLTAVSFAMNIHYVHTDLTAAYYSPFGRFWELMIGALLAYAHGPGRMPFPAPLTGNILSLAGVFMIAAALLLVRSTSSFPGYWALLPTLGTACLIAAGGQAWFNRVVLASRPFVFFGLISYPLYLWHWPLLAVHRVVFGYHVTSHALALVALAILLATLTFFFIERPFRGRDERVAKPVLLGLAMLCIAGFGFLVSQGLVPVRNHAFQPSDKTEWDFLKSRYPQMGPNGDGIYRFGAGRTGQTLFIGDSQLAQYAERIATTIDRNADAHGATFYIGGGCVPLAGVFIDSLERKDCWPVRDQGYAAALDPTYDRVVIGASWNWYLLNSLYTIATPAGPLPLSSAQGRELALASLEKTLLSLRRDGRQVFLLLGNPILHGWRVASPSNRIFNTLPVSGSRMDYDESEQQLAGRLMEIAQRTGAKILGPYGSICSNGSCEVISEAGRPIFKDSSHFNPDWVSGAEMIDSTVMK
ncbi:acyltransferase family protein [Allorhizobium undicola]|uniref:acyltransferase family protein n=1 Tax=Allorhizobium undicola TaxID=78527 RepID=UPI0006872E4E|nr:acyltransferase family protein [Allorhizobium undicola]